MFLDLLTLDLFNLELVKLMDDFERNGYTVNFINNYSLKRFSTTNIKFKKKNYCA